MPYVNAKSNPFQSRRPLGLVLTIAIAVFSLAAPARADEAADTATARALGVDGVTLADAGKCKEAIEKLARAEKLHHAPTTATRLGECEIETGKIVLGTERLQRVIREPLAPNAHPAFAAAVARAQRALDLALPRVATLRISVAAPQNAKVTIMIDGEPISDAVLDSGRRIDPGMHTIEARADGFLAISSATALGDGETKSVVLELHPDPNARTITPVVPEPTTEQRAPEPKRSKVPAIVAFGVGAIGLGVGLYASSVVEDKSAVLRSGCDANRVCPSNLQPELDRAKKWATVSTAGFIGAGVGVATGIVLLFASGATTSSAGPKANVRVHPTVGAGSIGLDGVF